MFVCCLFIQCVPPISPVRMWTPSLKEWSCRVDQGDFPVVQSSQEPGHHCGVLAWWQNPPLPQPQHLLGRARSAQGVVQHRVPVPIWENHLSNALTFRKKHVELGEEKLPMSYNLKKRYLIYTLFTFRLQRSATTCC